MESTDERTREQEARQMEKRRASIVSPFDAVVEQNRDVARDTFLQPP